MAGPAGLGDGGGGQHELLNWMCLAGALDALGRGPGETTFMETWAFNSSKVFLISKPGD